LYRVAEKVVNGPEDLGFSAAWFASPTSFPPLDTLVPGTGCPQVKDAKDRLSMWMEPQTFKGL